MCVVLLTEVVDWQNHNVKSDLKIKVEQSTVSSTKMKSVNKIESIKKPGTFKIKRKQSYYINQTLPIKILKPVCIIFHSELVDKRGCMMQRYAHFELRNVIFCMKITKSYL